MIILLTLHFARFSFTFSMFFMVAMMLIAECTARELKRRFGEHRTPFLHLLHYALRAWTRTAAFREDYCLTTLDSRDIARREFREATSEIKSIKRELDAVLMVLPRNENSEPVIFDNPTKELRSLLAQYKKLSKALERAKARSSRAQEELSQAEGRIRVEPLGRDRHSRIYWYFASSTPPTFDTAQSPIAIDDEQNGAVRGYLFVVEDGTTWKQYKDLKTDIPKLIEWLCPLGAGEGSLRLALQDVLASVNSNEK